MPSLPVGNVAVAAAAADERKLADPAGPPSLAARPSATDGAPVVLHERGKHAYQLLDEQIESLYKWANKNRRATKWDTFWFWALKVPIIVASASYGLLLKFDLQWQLAAAGALSAACVLIDGLFQPGSLRNAHHRAYFELTMLADDLHDQWAAAVLDQDLDLNNVASNLISEARTRKGRVTGYLSETETALGENSKSLKEMAAVKS